VNLQQLIDDAPAIHGEAGGNDLITHGLLVGALEFIDRVVQPGSRTLETGSGYSTILFALKGAQHTCIVPNQPEIDRILAYCEQQSIDTSGLTFVAQPSERVLPTLETGPLDLVLIDGSHSFPQVFIDWFYVAEALEVGGHILVDDVHLWTGRVLRDFLAAEPEWRIVDELGGRTSIVRKVGQVDPDRVWTEQPYVLKKTHLGAPTMARQSVSMVRHGHADELAARVREVARRRFNR
jgi:predicted O-methyltransferase YrrM